jgi:hypothetical protein
VMRRKQSMLVMISSWTRGVFGSMHGILAPLRRRDGPLCALRTGHGP